MRSVVGVESETKIGTAVIISGQVDMFDSLVEQAGYDVLGAADNAINGEALLAHCRPDVVLVDNDVPGTPGWESIPHLHLASPATRVLLVVNDDWTPSDLGAIGAFAVVSKSRLGDVVSALNELRDWADSHAGDASSSDERRTGHDRRLEQDWSKVGWDRRSAPRRDLLDA